MKSSLLLAGLTILSALPLSAQKKSAEKKPEQPAQPFLKSETYSHLSFRSVGPAVTSGRVIDIAVNPKNKNEWYIAAAAGGVFKTKNAGVTFQPIFDGQGVYSIGCLAIDKNNTNIVWVGTGENNNQRAVGYGDGVYKSEDGGKSFKNMGLAKSEHIGNIAIDPTNPDVVFVAAYGPVWSAGGDRGVYKTTDGGKTWKQVLTVSENTGFNEVHIDKNNPNTIYACAHQRRRHEWTYISGGPESAIYKSKDGGATWDKLTNGLPSGDVGRITMAISPVNTDIVYAMCEGRENKGFYKSTDRGVSWEKQSGKATDGNYYQEIIADPKNVDKVYVMDTWANVTTDGGKTFKGMGEIHKHVDNHALWIDPSNTQHYLMGCDGGLYESFDGAATWDYKANLPITQFYRVCVDNSKPFYYIYGGTQDNNTLGGPSRTISGSGITNADWFVTVGGDGFQSRVDPKEPNIIYSEWQYGGLVRFDRKSGEKVDIKPMEKDGEPAYRWNWDAPIIISNADNKRIYFAANKVFRSNDRGDSWSVISPDLSRQIDRNKLPVMGKVWSMDAVAKNASTSIFGNITALSESPKNENILYAGTDDGLIQVTDNGGSSWNKIDNIAGIPQITVGNAKMQPLVNYILCSQHNENVAYAVFNNHRQGDFKPYLVKTSDKGKTWTSISSNLPEKGSVYSIAEDHKNPDLLFCGTEFGIYFSPDAGKNWTELTGGLPAAVCIKDITIQKEENDLVIATFGRGIFILDDYSPLQNIKADDLNKKAHIFPIKDGLVFNPSSPYGHKGKSFQGESFFLTQNPPIGATITYFIKDDFKSIKEKRQEAEKEKIKNNQPVYYPSPDSLKLEDNEIPAYVLAIITDEQGNEIRKIKLDAKKGLKRFTWDGRYEVTSPINFHEPDVNNPYYDPDQGQPAIPGKYMVQLVKVYNGQTENLTDKVAFNITILNQSTLPLPDQQKMLALNKDMAEFRRVAAGTEGYYGTLKERIKYLKKGITNGSANAISLVADVNTFEAKAKELDVKLYGNSSMAKREYETLPGYVNLLEQVIYYSWSASIGATKSHEEKFNKLKSEFKGLYNSVVELKTLVESIEQKAEDLKMPATHGRLPKY
ncbi:MAG: glycosyl hydrolase repeat-containing protein [Bacteroidetes bacterium]|nr:glycosyl hydrolase repeat-containing protein [Bacteroidota bacterium]